MLQVERGDDVLQVEDMDVLQMENEDNDVLQMEDDDVFR